MTTKDCRLLLILAGMAGIIACGDGASQKPQDSDAGTEMLADAGLPMGSTIVTVGGDYAGTGVLTTVDVATLDIRVNAVAGVVGGDPALRRHGDRLYVIDRFGGNTITVLGRDLLLIDQVSTGAGSNPQDVVEHEDTLYVAALDAAGVLVIDRNAPTTIETIDLSELDAEDGIPDCTSIARVGERLYVACGILDRERWAPRGNGKVAVIDLSSRELVTTLELGAANPYSWLETTSPSGPLADDVLISTAPGALGGDVEAGCIERISTGDTPAHAGCLVTNAVLGSSYVIDLEGDAETLWMIVETGFGQDVVRALDLGEGAMSEAMTMIGEHVPGGLAVCPTGELVVADNGAERGLRVFEGASERTDRALDVGWPIAYWPINSTVCW